MIANPIGYPIAYPIGYGRLAPESPDPTRPDPNPIRGYVCRYVTSACGQWLYFRIRNRHLGEVGVRDVSESVCYA